jgi:hypothetical protein
MAGRNGRGGGRGRFARPVPGPYGGLPGRADGAADPSPRLDREYGSLLDRLNVSLGPRSSEILSALTGLTVPVPAFRCGRIRFGAAAAESWSSLVLVDASDMSLPLSRSHPAGRTEGYT